MLSRLVPAAVLAAALVLSGAASASIPPPPTEPISIGMAPASPRAGSDVRLTGAAGTSSWAWDLDDDGQFDDAVGKDVTTRFAAGTRTVRAQAVTAFGLVTDSRTFTVRDFNVAPGGIVTVQPYSARVGSPVTVTATGSDADGLSVVTALDLDGDGSFETAGSTGTPTFATAGERVIRARFTDDAGAESVATTTLDVHAGNLAPTARIQSPPNFTAAAGATTGPSGWTVAANDPDGEIVRYEFDLDGNGTFETDQGGDARIPQRAVDAEVVAVRVTDDGGAGAIERASTNWWLRVPAVAQVGVPVTLSTAPYSGVHTDATWDADGDGDFDDGTGREITFTYPSVGTYTVRLKPNPNTSPAEVIETTSVRDPADIAVPSARWESVAPARPTAPAYLSFSASTPFGLDLDGDGEFDDLTTPAFGYSWLFTGPVRIALKPTDARGRAAVATTDVPFVAGDLGPDAMMSTIDVDAPLRATYLRTRVVGGGSDADDGGCCQSRAWDTDNDGEYDDGDGGDVSGKDAPLASGFGVRVTDPAGVSTTVRRAIGPVPVAVSAPPQVTPAAWLRVSTRRARLATLLRRGLTVDVSCTKPLCRTRLVVKLEAKTARKVKLRSRTVASRSVTGSRRATVRLTPKARRALKHARSVKLVLTATATAPGARTSVRSTVTIRR